MSIEFRIKLLFNFRYKILIFCITLSKNISLKYMCENKCSSKKYDVRPPGLILFDTFNVGVKNTFSVSRNFAELNSTCNKLALS